MKSVKGFSLIELLVTVAIVGILAAIALPAYGVYVTRGKLAEAYSMLASQRVKMEQYYQDARTYVGACVDGTVAPTMPTGNFTYACDTLGLNTYRVVATGNPAQGMTGFQFTIDQANARSTTAVPAGWVAQAGCWIRNKGGEC